MADVVGADEFVFGEDGEDFCVDVEEARERPVRGFAGADAAELAGGGVGFELEVDDDGDVFGVGVGPVLELLQALDEGVAYGVGVEVCHVEDFETGLFQNVAVVRGAGVGEVEQRPDHWWVVESAFLVGVQIKLEGADGLMLELDV